MSTKSIRGYVLAGLLCLFPALYVVCFGPVVVSIYRAFLTDGM